MLDRLEEAMVGDEYLSVLEKLTTLRLAPNASLREDERGLEAIFALTVTALMLISHHGMVSSSLLPFCSEEAMSNPKALDALPTYATLHSYAEILGQSLPTEINLPRLAYDITRQTWMGIKRKLSECVRMVSQKILGFFTPVDSPLIHSVHCLILVSLVSLSNVIAASKPLGWPLQPQQAPTQAAQAAFAQAFLELLKFQLEFRPPALFSSFFFFFSLG